MQRYRELKRTLVEFVDQLPKTTIRFLFFRKLKDGSLVKDMKDTLHEWTVRDEPFYITYENESWCYFYRQSTIKYLVTQHTHHGLVITDKIDADIESVIDAETKKQRVNHGDHLTVTLLQTRDQGMFLKTHKTIYEEKMDPPFEFDRSEIYCSIFIDPDNIIITPKSQCHIRNQSPDPSDTLQHKYRSDPTLVDVILQIGKVLASKKLSGARQPIVHTGPRNGKYMIVNNTKKYMKMRGGNPFMYKTISFNDAFVGFIQENLFDRVNQLRPDLIGIRVVYDERNELHRNANKYIVIMYDFEYDAMQLYYIDARKAMMAFYAMQNERTATVEERTCLQEFMTNIQANIPRFVVSGGRK